VTAPKFTVNIKGYWSMPLYETVFIARQDIPVQEAEELAEKFSTIVGNNGGTIERCEYWGLRSLAYRIKKNRKGHYTMLHIDAPAQAVAEMERNMRIDEDILRYLTVRTDKLDEGPSIMMQNRRLREDRPPPRGAREQPKVHAAPGAIGADVKAEANVSPEAPAIDAAPGAIGADVKAEANVSPEAPAIDAAPGAIGADVKAEANVSSEASAADGEETVK
jgi:small subunit ribosomal protein S6